jgi:hypothetical protein
MHAAPAAEEPRPAPTRAELARARLLNLLGLVSPVANLGLVRLAPPDLRWFGVGAGVVCAGVAVWAHLTGRPTVLWAALGLHYALVLLGLAHPRLVEWPGRAWIAFGRLLGRVMIYPIFALIYYLAVTPTALAMRVCGKDPLRRRAPPEGSYWVKRKPVGRERYHRQF